MVAGLLKALLGALQFKQGENMKQRTLYTLGFSALVLLLAGFIGLTSGDSLIITDLIAIACAIIAVAIIQEFIRKEEPVSDERTKAITARASAVSWWLSYMLIAILILGEQFKIITANAMQVLGLVFFFMIFSQLAFRVYFNRKGDDV